MPSLAFLLLCDFYAGVPRISRGRTLRFRGRPTKTKALEATVKADVTGSYKRSDGKAPGFNRDIFHTETGEP